VSVQAHFPIFNSFGDYAAVRKAKAQKRKTEMTAERVRKGILLQATSASLNLKAAKTRIKIARKGVEQAEENLRIVQNMYDVGTLSNMDLIDTQLARNGTRANLINAVYDYYIAEAELERASGR
jgi:outer membrane protein TolC